MKKLLITLPIIAILLMAVIPLSAAAQPEPPIPAKKYEKIVLIHWAKGGRPGPPSAPEEPSTKVLDAYALLGPKWSSLPVSYVVNPVGGPSGAEEQIYLAFEAWDAVTSAELFSDTYTIDASAGPSTNSPDLINTISWKRIAPPSIIAMTIIWYDDIDNSGTLTDSDEFIETDMVFNAFLAWGIDPDGEGPAKLNKAYDVRNIATHEAGHVTGLADLYDETYSEITMYGYSSKGETKKTSLEIGDVLGCQALYGE